MVREIAWGIECLHPEIMPAQAEDAAERIVDKVTSFFQLSCRR
jgi:hypothetical protein